MASRNDIIHYTTDPREVPLHTLNEGDQFKMPGGQSIYTVVRSDYTLPAVDDPTAPGTLCIFVVTMLSGWLIARPRDTTVVPVRITRIEAAIQRG